MACMRVQAILVKIFPAISLPKGTGFRLVASPSRNQTPCPHLFYRPAKPQAVFRAVTNSPSRASCQVGKIGLFLTPLPSAAGANPSDLDAPHSGVADR